MRALGLKITKIISALCILHFAFFVVTKAQEPTPGPPKSVKIPAVKVKKLANGLTVAVVERKNVPLVTISLLIRNGADSEGVAKAGLANMTATLLTKGTKTRSATQIAEQIEFLGGSISSGAGWNSSSIDVSLAADKVDQAMSIMADVALNSRFDQKEIDLLKTQIQDGLAYNLTQPGFLANYVASVYSFNEHPSGGTTDSIKAITKADIVRFKSVNYKPTDAVLIFTGDISSVKANALATRFFAAWKSPPVKVEKATLEMRRPIINAKSTDLLNRLVVIDLPNSGQAAVNYFKPIRSEGRAVCFDVMRCQTEENFYPASVMNSVLGGGYSSRLNQEIRIKRGLSYGAGSGFSWRKASSNFGARTQTKNESAAEVAELVLAEIRKMTETAVSEKELNPRKLVVTGDFGRDLETTGGLAGAISDVYSYSLSTDELNSFMPSVQAVTAEQIRKFSNDFLKGGDIIIVGDYKVFKDDLAKRFPNVKVQVIRAEGLNLNNLAK